MKKKILVIGKKGPAFKESYFIDIYSIDKALSKLDKHTPSMLYKKREEKLCQKN